jgi:hypothetical protein
MKKFSKIILLLLFPLMAELVVSCYDCKCSEPVTTYYTHKSIKVSNIDTAKAPEPTTSDSIAKTSYALFLQLNIEKTACRTEPKLHFISPAYACDCVGDKHVAKEEVTAVKILSLKAFTPNEPADSDITDYFEGYDNGIHFSAEEFIKMRYLYGVSPTEKSLDFTLYLKAPEAFSGNHQFKVQITLTDGRILEGITQTYLF